MKIKIFVDKDDRSALQIWNYYYAFRQSQNRTASYCSDTEIIFHTVADIDKSSVNIAWLYMPDTLDSTIDRFDLVILDNEHHHLEVCSEAMFEALRDRSNCYIVSGAYVDALHPYYDKIIYAPMWFNWSSYFTRPFYPQYFEKRKSCIDERKPMIFINGKNRAMRQYMIENLRKHCPLMPILNTWNRRIPELEPSFFESPEDTDFRIMLNNNIQNFDTDCAIQDQDYYGQSVIVGIDGSHGAVQPGYFMIDQYFQYNCVIYPETAWLNSELFMTEKTMKCFISRCIPWPIGGALVHQYYNRLGFGTAWNLLPPEIQKFDSCTDHAERYDLQAQAIRWAWEHPEIWSCDHARAIIDSNHRLCFDNDFDASAPIKIQRILDSVTHRQQRSNRS